MKVLSIDWFIYEGNIGILWVKYHFHYGYYSFTQVTYGLQNFKDIETLMNLYEKNKITVTKIRKTSKLEKEKAELRKRGNQ